MKVSDYIASALAQHGIRHVFMVTGGGAMHLNDSFGKHSGLKYICNHHEQASAMAAESYARMSGKMAALCVTTGPGGINALNGVFGAWTDSMPMIVVSGQVRYDTTVAYSGLPLRQLGDQEFDIATCVRTMTKYSVMVTDPLEIRYHLERALYLATAGRPGPCWVDVPHNIQGASVEVSTLRPYDPNEDRNQIPSPMNAEGIQQLLRRIEIAKRPVIFAGPGIRISGAVERFGALINRLQVPVVTAFNSHDVILDDHPLYVGRPGTIGDRTGNFAVQNSDLLIVLGCRLNIRQIGYNYPSFARAAYKVVVDADPVELQKPTVQADWPLHADVSQVIDGLLSATNDRPLEAKREWIHWLKERKKRYPVVLPEYWEKQSPINPYCFVDRLNAHLAEGDAVICGDATACITPFQALRIRKGQRLYSNSGSASMGYDLPAAIGAAFASPGTRIICLAGDGSIQMNLQELQTIVHHQAPIKIFVLNNGGYHSIRQTQNNFFGAPLVGCDAESGVSFPNMERIAYAYGIPYSRAESLTDLDSCLAKTLAEPGPSMCEVLLDKGQSFSPRSSSKRLANGKMVSKPLEDMFPFLSREEFLENMLIPPIEEPTE